MPHKEVKIAKNVTRLLGMCCDRNMSQEQIHILTKPIREARIAEEKETIALSLIEELDKK